MRIQGASLKFEMWVRSGENNRITSESKHPPSPSCSCWHRTRSQEGHEGSVILSSDWSRGHNTELWLVRGDNGYSENSDEVVGTMLGGSMVAHLQHIQISLTTSSSVWNLNPGIQYFEWAITSSLPLDVYFLTQTIHELILTEHNRQEFLSLQGCLQLFACNILNLKIMRLRLSPPWSPPEPHLNTEAICW